MICLSPYIYTYFKNFQPSVPGGLDRMFSFFNVGFCLSFSSPKCKLSLHGPAMKNSHVVVEGIYIVLCLKAIGSSCLVSTSYPLFACVVRLAMFLLSPLWPGHGFLMVTLISVRFRHRSIQYFSLWGDPIFLISSSWAGEAPV